MKPHTAGTVFSPTPHLASSIRLLFIQEGNASQRYIFFFYYALNSGGVMQSLELKHGIILLVIMQHSRLKVLLKGTLAAVVSQVVDPPPHFFMNRHVKIDD